jgi:predicted RNase H-like HicB family nuclease
MEETSPFLIPEQKLAQFWQSIESKGPDRDAGHPAMDRTEAEMSGYRFSAYVIRDVEGWTAVCPEFPDCRARGTTYEHALANLRDIIQVYVEDGLGDDEPVPQHDEASFTTLSF